MSMLSNRCLSGLTVAAFLLGAATQSQAQWSFSWLDPLPGDERALPIAVSADGSVIVGESIQGEYHTDYQPEAFYWTEQRGTTGLDFLPGHAWSEACAVSADGSVIVGYSQTEIGEDSQGEAFRWTEAGGMVGLDFLPGDEHSWANGVSADGSVVVGFSGGWGPNPGSVFRWTETGGMIDLGYPEGGAWSRALAVSADGSTVVGQWGTPSSAQLAFYWTQQDDMVDLHALLGANVRSALDVSADGSVIVGSVYGLLPGDPHEQAFRWTADGGTLILGDPTDNDSSAAAVSEDGSLVVGMYSPPSTGGLHAFLWDAAHGRRDLTELLIAEGVDLDVGQLYWAKDVSFDGRTITIVGDGGDPNGYGLLGWTASYVVPEPSALAMLLGIAAAAAIAMRRRSR